MTKSLILMTAALLGSSGAIAQPPVVVTGEQAPFKIVSYADLNLSSRAGQDRLVHRIRSAAGDLCYEGNKEEVQFATARRSCFNSAVNGGLRQMDLAIAGRTPNTGLAAATLIISRR